MIKLNRFFTDKFRQDRKMNIRRINEVEVYV